MIKPDIPLLSKKQKLAYSQANKRINIWCGAVRSGKTYSSLIKFIELLTEGPRGDTLVVGVTRDAIQRNVITDLCKLINAKVPSSKSNEMTFLGRKIYFVGANDERAVRRIQGSTLALAYVDECAEVPENFWNMLLSRLSVPGAQLLASCNPSNPMHWLKQKFLDHEDELNLISWKFVLDDNPILTDEYKNALKKEYTGMWYKRYILGEWAVAHGLIYDQFDNDNLYTQEPNNPDFLVCGIDYGSANPTAAVILACSPSRYPQLRVQDTFYFNSAEAGRGKTDSELADDIEEWLKRYPVKTIYLDPSALSFKLELGNRGLPVKSANNNVEVGIQTVNKWIGGKNLLVHSSCKKLIEEIKSYSWDPKAVERGEDKPIKKFDHLCFVKGTMISTDSGDVPIQDLCVGDCVLTRSGYKKVVATMSSRSCDIWELKAGDNTLTATGNHPIWTGEGYIPLNSLTGCFKICRSNRQKIDSVAIIAKQNIEEFQGLIMKIEAVNCVSKPLSQTNIIELCFAREDVQENLIDVYNLTVEDEHEYFANGILVSNCDALRYSVFSTFPKGTFGELDKDYSIDAVRQRAYGSQSNGHNIFGEINSSSYF